MVDRYGCACDICSLIKAFPFDKYRLRVLLQTELPATFVPYSELGVVFSWRAINYISYNVTWLCSHNEYKYSQYHYFVVRLYIYVGMKQLLNQSFSSCQPRTAKLCRHFV